MFTPICNPSMRPFVPCRGVLSAFYLMFRSNLRVQVNFGEPLLPWDVLVFIATSSTFLLFDMLTLGRRFLHYTILSIPQSLGICILVC